jgi:hypothetical protein
MATARDKTNGPVPVRAKALLPGGVRVIYQRFLSFQDDRAATSVHSSLARRCLRTNDALYENNPGWLLLSGR